MLFFELSIQRILNYYFFFWVLTKILNRIIFNIDEIFVLAPNIRIISEESCDTEDWSNDDFNSALLSKEQMTLQNTLK